MTRRFLTLTFVLALAVTATPRLRAQDKPVESGGAVATIPLKIQVVIARYDGPKKLSSLPYMLSVNAGSNASMRVGTKVPVASTSYTPVATGGAGVNPLTSYQYQDVGTNIDCRISQPSDGRFRIELSLEDSSVYPDDQPKPAPVDRPSFRSFRVTNSLVLKDGQTAEFTTAVDKITGVVTKVDVTLNVVK